ncbi:hypothetical protein SCHPADRAFT_1002413, partial [Schizopora paradoxa]
MDLQGRFKSFHSNKKRDSSEIRRSDESVEQGQGHSETQCPWALFTENSSARHRKMDLDELRSTLHASRDLE